MFASSTIQTLLQNQTDSESKGNRSLSNRSNPPVIHHSHSRKTLAETKTAKILVGKKKIGGYWKIPTQTKKKQQTSFSHQSTATNFRQRPPGGCQQQDTSAVLHTRCSLFSFCASYPLPKQKGPRTRTESPIPSWDAPHEHQAKRRSLAKKSEKFPTAQVMSMLLDVYNVLWVQEWNNVSFLRWILPVWNKLKVFSPVFRSELPKSQRLNLPIYLKGKKQTSATPPTVSLTHWWSISHWTNLDQFGVIFPQFQPRKVDQIFSVLQNFLSPDPKVLTRTCVFTTMGFPWDLTKKSLFSDPLAVGVITKVYCRWLLITLRERGRWNMASTKSPG